MSKSEMVSKDAPVETKQEKKKYEAPWIKQLGTVEDLTRWEASVTVGG